MTDDSAFVLYSISTVVCLLAYVWPKDPPPGLVFWSVNVFPFSCWFRAWLVTTNAGSIPDGLATALAVIVAVFIGTITYCLVHASRNIVLALVLWNATLLVSINEEWWIWLIVSFTSAFLAVLTTKWRISDRMFYLVYSVLISTLALWQTSFFLLICIHGDEDYSHDNNLVWWMVLVLLGMITCRLAWVYHWQWRNGHTEGKKLTSASDYETNPITEMEEIPDFDYDSDVDVNALP